MNLWFRLNYNWINPTFIHIEIGKCSKNNNGWMDVFTRRNTLEAAVKFNPTPPALRDINITWLDSFKNSINSHGLPKPKQIYNLRMRVVSLQSYHLVIALIELPQNTLTMLLRQRPIKPQVPNVPSLHRNFQQIQKRCPLTEHNALLS